MGEPIETQFGPLRTFTMAASDHPNHPSLARRMQTYLRWRNTHARHPDVLAAQGRERARIRSERHQCWVDHKQHDQVNIHGQRTRRCAVTLINNAGARIWA